MKDYNTAKKALIFIQYAALANSLYQLTQGNFAEAIASLFLALSLEKMVVALAYYCRGVVPLEMGRAANEISQNYSYPSQAFGLFSQSGKALATHVSDPEVRAAYAKSFQKNLATVQTLSRDGMNKAQDGMNQIVNYCRK